jgi:hypothetical protein
LLTGFEGLDYGVSGGVEMFGGVFILRVVAAADMSTDQKHAQVNPSVTHFQTFFAAVNVRGYVLNLIEVGARDISHIFILSIVMCCSRLS